MKDIFTAPFVEEMRKTTANMYRLGWDERNGGNISWMLDESEVAEYLDLNEVKRTIPLGFDATAIIGKIFASTISSAKKAPAKAAVPAPKAAPAAKSGKADEEMSAICMALHEHFGNVHDEESDVLTIVGGASGWNSLTHTRSNN